MAVNGQLHHLSGYVIKTNIFYKYKLFLVLKLCKSSFDFYKFIYFYGYFPFSISIESSFQLFTCKYGFFLHTEYIDRYLKNQSAQRVER